MAHLATARRRSPAGSVDSVVAAQPGLPARPRRIDAERWLAATIAAALLLLWELLSQFGVLSRMFMPAPSTIARTLVREFSSGLLLAHLGATFLRIVPGLLLGALPGLLLGLMMGWSGRLRRIVDPFVAATHPMPKVALLPLLMILFGIGEAPKIIVIAVASFFPMLLNAMAGVRQISPVHFEVARNYGAGTLQMLRRVVLPGSLPMVLTGLRLTANVALALTIAVEIAAAQTGLGSLVWLSWQVLRVELLYATIVVTALFGLSMNVLLGWLARRFVPWLPDRQPLL
ncbi:MAG: ABC transporter permease [Longimicrobiales bacterium]